VQFISEIPLVTTRHDTLSSLCILAQEKVVTCCVALVGQHGATRRACRDATLGMWVNTMLILCQHKRDFQFQMQHSANGKGNYSADCPVGLY